MATALIGCLVLPGLGWARRLRLRDLGDTAALSVVLSVSATALVATTMVVLGRWSSSGGAVVLTAISVLGFVPVRAVGARAGVFLFGRPLLTADGDQERAAEALAAEEEWRDWYVDVRQRVDEERRQREAEAAVAEREWRDWVVTTRQGGGGEWRGDLDPADQLDDRSDHQADDQVEGRQEWWDGRTEADAAAVEGGAADAAGIEGTDWRTDSAARHP